jgi:hypothetical protein
MRLQRDDVDISFKLLESMLEYRTDASLIIMLLNEAALAHSRLISC